MPDGEAVERSVRRVRRSQSSWRAGYHENGVVTVDGEVYYAYREVVSTSGHAYSSLPWTVHPDPIGKPRTRQQVLSAAGKRWFDRAVEWLLLEQYAPRTDYLGRVVLDGGTVASVAANLLDNWSLEAVEHRVGSPAPEDAAVAWVHYRYERNRWTTQIRNSLERLRKRGRVFEMIGSGERGGDARYYAHTDYYGE